MTFRFPRSVVPVLWLAVLILGAALPANATFSLCAIDPETGEAGVIVTTRVPFVGRAVPWVRAGVGAVATQSWTVVEYGPGGLDLLEEGLAPQEVLDRLLADDEGRELRQLGVIDMEGRTAAFTGADNGTWAGSRQGPHYTVQGNLLVGREVIDAVADHFESTEGSGMPLAERMIRALLAGQAEGGDSRWGNLQSAALKIADPSDPGRGGDHLSFDIQVGEHPEPVRELERIYLTTERRLGYRTFSEIRGPDVVELKRRLHTLGYYRKELDAIPEPPDFDFDRSRLREDPDGFQKAVESYRDEARAYSEAWQIYDGDTMDAVDAFRKDHDLDHPGLPRGLVDEALAEALQREIHRRPPDEDERGGAEGAPDESGDTQPAGTSSAETEAAEARTADELPYEIHDLAPGVWAALQPTPLRFRDSNSLVIRTDQGVLVVDSQSDPARVRLLAREIRRRTGEEVRFVINTHWHGDHTQGNAVYRELFGDEVRFLAHSTWWRDVQDRALPQLAEEMEATRDAIARAEERLAAGVSTGEDGGEEREMTDEEKADLAGRIERTKDRVGRLAALDLPAPTLTFTDQLTLHLTWRGEPRPIRLIHLRGHTRGDVVVHLPSVRLLATGDLLDDLPFGGHGYPREWIGALDALDTLDFERVVPGHGSIQEGREPLHRVRAMFTEIVAQAEAAAEGGNGLEEAKEAAMASEALLRFREAFVGEDAVAGRAFDAFVPATFERAYLEAKGELSD